mgnify:CR=1 FL=1
MSNAVSALQGKAASGEVTVREGGLRGMITIRGNLASTKLQNVVKKLSGVAMPNSQQANVDGDKGLAWMSTDELLLLVPHGDTDAAIAAIAKAMKGQHYLAETVSDARALITVEGDFAREVVAKLAPVDLHSTSFMPGDFRRSRLGQVAAAFWMRDDDTIDVICFRSVADYTFNLLAAAAKGGRVGFQ